MRTIVAGLLLLGVGCRPNPNEATFTQNVGSAFQECRSQEVRFLAGKHNFMTAFDPCGSNNFQQYAWNPAGTHLYFQLTQSGHIMNADAPNKATVFAAVDAMFAAKSALKKHRMGTMLDAVGGLSSEQRAQVIQAHSHHGKGHGRCGKGCGCVISGF